MQSVTARILSWCSASAALLFLSTPTFAQDRESLVMIGTGSPNGVYFSVGNAICKMLHQSKDAMDVGMRCGVTATNGSNDNISRVMGGEFALGVVQSDWQFHAINGSSHWQDNPQDDLQAVMSLHAEPFQVITAADSGITAWADLLGKRVNIGNIGSGHRGTMEEMLKMAGWKLSSFAKATQMASTEHARALCQGDIDAYVFSVGVPSKDVRFALDRCNATLIDLKDSPASQLVTADRPFYSWTTISPAAYPQLDAAITTFGVRATLVTRKDVPEELVYQTVKAVFDNFANFRSEHKALDGLDKKGAISDGISAPLHAGALRYYKEQGLL